MFIFETKQSINLFNYKIKESRIKIKDSKSELILLAIEFIFLFNLYVSDLSQIIVLSKKLLVN